MSHRVLLITNLKLKVFEWKGHHLDYAFEFKNDETGLSEFEEYISSVKRVGVHILFDLLEEDFQREKIPHTHGSDKQLLIERQVKRHYRNNTYVHAHQISREKSGRKDDEILLSSISGMEPIAAWIEIMGDKEVPIIGMWSVSLLNEKLMGYLSEKKENVLLISRQMKSSMRESFLQKGKLILSRQVRIEKQYLDNEGIESYVTSSVSQIHRFLANSRIIGFNSKLYVKCILPEALVEEARASLRDTDNIEYIFISIESLFKRLGLKTDLNNKQADTIFSYICSKQKSGTDHYARNIDKKHYKNLIIEKSISNFTYMCSVALFLASTALVTMGITLNSEKKTAKANLQHLNNHYQRNYSKYESEIGYAYPMDQQVTFSKLLINESNFSPESLFLPLSQVFSRPQYNRINLTGFKWKKYHGEPLRQLVVDMNKMAKKQNDTFEEFGFEEDLTPQEGRSPLIELSGLINRNDISYRDTVAILKNFVNDLDNLGQIQSTWVKQIPVDTRVYSRFSDQSGVDESKRVIDESANKFLIYLLLHPTNQPKEEELLTENLDSGEVKNG